MGRRKLERNEGQAVQRVVVSFSHVLVKYLCLHGSQLVVIGLQWALFTSCIDLGLMHVGKTWIWDYKVFTSPVTVDGFQGAWPASPTCRKNVIRGSTRRCQVSNMMGDQTQPTWQNCCQTHNKIKSHHPYDHKNHTNQIRQEFFKGWRTCVFAGDSLPVPVTQEHYSQN